MNEGLTATRLAIGMFFLIIASAQDIRRRRVNDLTWILMGSFGIALIAVQLLMDKSRWEYFLVLIPVAILFFDIFWDREPIYEDGRFKFVPIPILLYLLGFTVLMWLFVGFNGDFYFLQLFAVTIMILVCYALYYSGLIRGGADAKALICISILIPSYPILNGLPIISVDPVFLEVTSVLFPFALVVLLNASILFLFVPLAFLLYNLKEGNAKLPQCFVGYKVDIERVPRFVWLMERIENGELKMSIFPKRSDNKVQAIRKLKEYGLGEVWVTPQIPFIVPINIGFFLSFILGNIIFGVILLFT